VVRFLIKRTKLIFEETKDEEFEDPDLDKAQQFNTLRSQLRFSTTPILLPTGAVALTHKSGDVLTDKSTDREISHELAVFSRDIGNQGLLFLLDREIDDINGRLSRLTNADSEIAKWDGMASQLFVVLLLLLFMCVCVCVQVSCEDSCVSSSVYAGCLLSRYMVTSLRITYA
jgi:hypothetical protein